MTDDYYDLGSYHRTLSRRRPGPSVVRPRAGLGLRVQPRRGDPLLRARRCPWTPNWRSRAGASRTRSDRTTTRRGRRSIPSTWRRRWRGPGWNSRLAVKGRAICGRTRPDRRAASPLPHRRSRTTSTALAAGHAAYADAMVALAAGLSRRHRRPDPGRRRAGQRHRMGAVGHHAPVNPRRVRRVVEAKRILDDALATRCRPRTSRCPAPLPAHHGDVGPPRGSRCPQRTCCAAWCPTPATCSTCPPTSTCCAVTTAVRW